MAHQIHPESLFLKLQTSCHGRQSVNKRLRNGRLWGFTAGRTSITSRCVRMDPITQVKHQISVLSFKFSWGASLSGVMHNSITLVNNLKQRPGTQDQFASNVNRTYPLRACVSVVRGLSSPTRGTALSMSQKAPAPKTCQPEHQAMQWGGGAGRSTEPVAINAVAVVSAQELPHHCQFFCRNRGRGDL